MIKCYSLPKSYYKRDISKKFAHNIKQKFVETLVTKNFVKYNVHKILLYY